jgi:hypothetical protein
MTANSQKPQDDPDTHKGATEGETPADEEKGNPAGTGIDKNGMPNDPIATAQDKVGANEDESQG